MRRPTLAAVLVLLATSAAASDYYLPLGGATSRTELELGNYSTGPAMVTIELLDHSRTMEISLDAGQTTHLNDVLELFGLGSSAEVGALRITAAHSIEVKARSSCEACGSRVTLPILDARHAVEDGTGPMRAPLPWRSGMLVVNPGNVTALMTLTIHRGDEIVEQSLLRIPARGTRRVPLTHGADHHLTWRSARPLLLFGYDSNEGTGARLFRPLTPQAVGGKRRSVRSAPSTTLPPVPQTLVLTPSKDNTLYQSSGGTLSNGAGVHLFAGATGSRSLRRALVAFDVAAQLPPGSRITRATLQLQVSLTIAGPQRMALYRVTTSWGEGSSNAGSSRDGTGAAARTGDATWLHRFFPDQRWTAQGGDFNPSADATTTDQGSVTWESSDAMIARVQEWLDQPSTNFGWIVIGNETENATAKRLDSREVGPATRPALTIEFLH